MTATTGATHAAMAELNRSRVIQLLHREGVCSRAHIARELGLTPAAITKITAQLISMGIVSETGAMDGMKKRRSIGLRLNEARYHVIGVKIARSLVQIGVFDLRGTLTSMQTLPPVSEETIHDTCEEIRRRINAFLDADPSIVAIGMAVPGPYLKSRGRTAVITSMLGWREINFLDEFAHAFRVPVFMEHDARAGALAQYLFADDPMPDDLGYYLLGEGVGLGLIDNGRLIDGALGTATEIGHISIDVHGRPCDCGNRGCLESYCSAVALHRAINESGVVPGSRDMHHTDACMALFSLIDQGNDRALDVATPVFEAAGYGCVTIINAFNPRRIVIGDIMAGAGDHLLRVVQDIVNHRVLPELREATVITLSSLPSDATLMGAGAVAATQFLERPSEFAGRIRRRRGT